MSNFDPESATPTPDEMEGTGNNLPEYETDSGVTVDISDIEVDVAPSESGVVVSSQADAEAYGVEPAEEGSSSTATEDRD